MKRTLNVTGMHCASCVSTIQNALKKVPGVTDARVSLATNIATVDGERLDHATLAHAIHEAGYGVAAEHEGHATTEAHQHGVSRASVIRSAILALPLIVSMVWTPDLGRIGSVHVGELILGLIASWIVLVEGRHTFLRAWMRLKHLQANMDTLVALGTATALAWGYVQLITGVRAEFESAGVVMTAILVGSWLESKARGAAGDAIAKLGKELPETAHKLDANDTHADVLRASLEKGDRIRILVGDRVPMDAVIEQGSSAVNEALLTGESMPREVQVGDHVFAGTINVTGVLTCRVERAQGETRIDDIRHAVEQALSQKSPMERLADRVSSIFVPAVIGIALLAGGGAYLFGFPVGIAISRAVAVLVIACPCALGLATPVAMMVGLGRGAKNGLLWKDATGLEASARVTTIMFDKTGTLTQGTPVVTDVWTEQESKELLALAGSLELHSEHPLARAIVERAKQQGSELVQPTDVQVHVGVGIEGVVNGARMRVESITATTDPRVDTWRNEGKTVVGVWKNDELAGYIAMRDEPKQGAREAIASLKRHQWKTVMLTGDHAQTAQAIAHELGIDEVIAECKPEEKAARVQERKQAGEHVAFVGDGVNDAPALATADLGLAMGSGSDVARSAGHAVLVRGDVAQVEEAILLARATVRTIRQNLWWAFGYNVLLIPLAALGVLPPMAAGIAMGLSSVSVVLNSLRLKSGSIR